MVAHSDHVPREEEGPVEELTDQIGIRVSPKIRAQTQISWVQDTFSTTSLEDDWTELIYRLIEGYLTKFLPLPTIRRISRILSKETDSNQTTKELLLVLIQRQWTKMVSRLLPRVEFETNDILYLQRSIESPAIFEMILKKDQIDPQAKKGLLIKKVIGSSQLETIRILRDYLEDEKSLDSDLRSELNPKLA